MKYWLHGWLLRHWYGERPIWWLIPLNWLFVILTTWRRGLYRTGVLLPASVAAPVIVIGNINVGGSGKTPFTLWLADRLRAAGYRPGIITRGYGGKSRHWPRRVTAEDDARQVGDEAALLARRSGLPVAAGPDRVAAANLLIEQHQVNLILSDDGLQHYRLPRCVEIIMLDGARGLGNGWRLPAGPLRETSARLHDAHFVVVKAGVGVPRLSLPGALSMHLELDQAVSLADGARRDLRAFAAGPVHAVAGIADPAQFFAALEAQGLQVDGRALPDHARFTSQDLNFADDSLPVLMTEKDAVKCREMQTERHWFVPATAHLNDDDATRLMLGLRAYLELPAA